MKDVRKAWYGVTENTDDPQAKVHWYVNKANAPKNAQRLANQTGKSHTVVICTGPSRKALEDGRCLGVFLPEYPEDGMVEVTDKSVLEVLQEEVKKDKVAQLEKSLAATQELLRGANEVSAKQEKLLRDANEIITKQQGLIEKLQFLNEEKSRLLDDYSNLAARMSGK